MLSAVTGSIASMEYVVSSNTTGTFNVTVDVNANAAGIDADTNAAWCYAKVDASNTTVNYTGMIYALAAANMTVNITNGSETTIDGVFAIDCDANGTATGVSGSSDVPVTVGTAADLNGTFTITANC